MADGAESITAAWREVFDLIRAMCYCHVIRKVNIQLKILPPELQALISADIFFLHCSESTVIFDAALSLFLAHWRSYVTDSVTYVLLTLFVDFHILF